MPPRLLLASAADLLKAVMRLAQPADAVVSAHFRAYPGIGPRERHALAETIYAVLRRRLAYAQAIKGQPPPAERWLAILAWQGAPAVLQSALNDGERVWLVGAAARLAEFEAGGGKLAHNLPDWIGDRLKAQLGAAAFEPLALALLAPAPLDLRVNAFRAKRDEVRAALAEAGIVAAETPHSPWGLRIEGKPALNRLPGFLRGDFEVQDEGSQLLALLTGAGRGEMVVDFCAGAGGKALALGAMMRSTGRLYAFDTSAHRLKAFEPRLKRSGLSNVHPAAIAHERDDRVKRLAGKIDRVLVDAPCSGLGTLRRNPDLKWRQSPEALAELAEKQFVILRSAARLLRPGGRLVYATCSLLAEENEAVAARFGAEAGGDFSPIPAGEILSQARVEAAESLACAGNLRLWPHLHATDGFFASVWQRRG
jgi:16S rRNA (cytosine967-C5)-methyltransferase